MLGGYKIGILSVLGITIGIGFHIVYSSLFIIFFSENFLQNFIWIKSFASIYLVFLSYKIYKSSKNKEKKIATGYITPVSAFKMALFIDLLNPAIGVFYIILWGAILQEGIPKTNLLIAAIISITLVMLYFFLIVLFFSNQHLRKFYINNLKNMESLAAVLLLLFALLIFKF